jgi:U4/U6.U5 tri-snRNP-associated protein 3
MVEAPETEIEVSVGIESIVGEVCLLFYVSCVLSHCSKGYPSKPGRYERSRSPVHNGTRARSRTPPSRGTKADRRNLRRNVRPGDGERQTNGVSDAAKAPRGRDEQDTDVQMKGTDEGVDDVEAAMTKTMGFSRFRSTQNTKVPGNNIYGVRKEKKTQYRQYMNRPGGFNRPLSPTR